MARPRPRRSPRRRPDRWSRAGRRVADAGPEDPVRGHGRARRCARDAGVLRQGAPRRVAEHADFRGALLRRSGTEPRRPRAARVLRGRRRRDPAGDHHHGRRRGARRHVPERAHAVLARHGARQPRPARATARRDVGLQRRGRPRLADTACCEHGGRLLRRSPAVAARRRPRAGHRARAAIRCQRRGGDAPHGRARGDVRDPRRYALGKLVPRREWARVLARLAVRAARQLGDGCQLPPRDRARHRRSPRARSRPPPSLPRAGRVVGRARARVGRGVGAVLTQLLVRLFSLGHHADQLARSRVDPHSAARGSAHRPRHVPAPRCGVMSDSDVVPFRVAFDAPAIEGLRARLRSTRWPERETVDDWSQGIPLAFVQDLAAYWCDEYDFAAAEQRLNAWPQFTTRIDDIDVHFVHARSPDPEALPLVITHGWPGSVVEFFDVLGPLIDPVAHGGDAADAFHVVCPSLPGYGFSTKPTTRGRGVPWMAHAWATLMSRLAYERFAAQGGDWGSAVTTTVGELYRDRVFGVHINMPTVPLGPLTDDSTPSERRNLEDFEWHT